MLYIRLLIAFAFQSFLRCPAKNVPPPAQHAVAESAAFIEIQNVMLAGNSWNAQIPRSANEVSAPFGDASSESPFAVIKRALLGPRYFTCDPGFTLCSSIYCCSSSEVCCKTGCAKVGQTCCSKGGACDAGYFCCADYRHCAPNGGECCNDGTSCDAGLHCVIRNGVRGCCKDLSCSSFSYDFAPASPPSLSLTLPSPSPTLNNPLIPSPSSPSLVTPAPAAKVTRYRYFTKTWIYSYYTYYMTIIPPNPARPTSSDVIFSTTVSFYATDSADAESQFSSLTAPISFPSAVTAAGYTSGPAANDDSTGLTPTATSSRSATATSSRSATATSSRSATATAGGATASSGGGSVAAASGGVRNVGSLLLLVGSCLGIIGIGLLAVWL